MDKISYNRFDNVYTIKFKTQQIFYGEIKKNQQKRRVQLNLMPLGETLKSFTSIHSAVLFKTVFINNLAICIMTECTIF
jgi:hypothetical protein